MPRKAIVHIGPMKTGSTSIQSWLNRKRQKLLEAGVLVPTSLGASNMSRLAYMSQVVAAGEDVTPIDARRLTALREEIAALPESVTTTVFSGEMLGHQLRRVVEVQAFKSILDEFFDDYTIILYLRRQDELSLSRYSTALRHGFKWARPLLTPIDYEKILIPWAEVFGRDAIRARLFDRNEMPGGDVVRDFAEAAGLPMFGTKSPERNSSILPEAQVFLADLANRVRDSGFTGPFMEVAGHEIIDQHLNSQFRGKGMKPSRADAVAFCEKIHDSNERVRAAWFPDRATLFSQDFTAYSEEATPAPSPETMLEVAMSALVALITHAAPDEPSDAKTDTIAPRRDMSEKKEMRGRRKLHRKMRGGGRKKAAKAESL